MNGTYVLALAVAGSDLYAGGDFTTAGGVSANGIAKWNGTTWSALGSGMNEFGTVRALAVSGTDVYAGGSFATAGGVSANCIAQWNGSAWRALGSGMSGPDPALGGMVIALAVAETDLYAGGWFTAAGGKLSKHIAQFTKPPGPEIDIEQPLAVPLLYGSSGIIWGAAPVASSGPRKTFTVMSTGTSDLIISAAAPSGGNASDFTVDTTGMATTVPTGDPATFVTTFAVTFIPSGPGLRSTTLQIFSNDADESPFDITLSGTGLSFTNDGDGDGLNDASEFQLAALGFNWQDGTQPQKDLVSTYYAHANGAGLYTPSQVQALHIDTPLIQRNGAGLYTLTLGLRKSTTLLPGSFLPFPFIADATVINGDGKIEFQFSSEDDAAFFRLETD
jgi:hypothetical protein